MYYSESDLGDNDHSFQAALRRDQRSSQEIDLMAENAELKQKLKQQETTRMKATVKPEQSQVELDLIQTTKQHQQQQHQQQLKKRRQCR